MENAFCRILFPIMGMGELLLDDLPRDSREYENAKEIVTAAKRGSELVKQILSFSRQHDHELVPVRIERILKEVIKLSRSTIPTNIEIKEDIQPDCGRVTADPKAFDLVLSDMTMPIMTGDELARRLIAIRPELPVIIITGFSERLDRQQAETIGVKGFLMKPVVRFEMAEMVRKVLDKAKIS
jgi:CheY-like chemotaxis protein